LKIIDLKLWAHFQFLSTLEASETLKLSKLYLTFSRGKDPKIDPLARYYQPAVKTVDKKFIINFHFKRIYDLDIHLRSLSLSHLNYKKKKDVLLLTHFWTESFF
jgi:hypothetical protein